MKKVMDLLRSNPFWTIFGIGAGLITLGTIFILINTVITDYIGVSLYLLSGLWLVFLIIIGIYNFFKYGKKNI